MINFSLKLFLISILIKLKSPQNFPLRVNSTVGSLYFTNQNKLISTSYDGYTYLWDPLNNWTNIKLSYNPFNNINYAFSFLSNNGLLAVSDGNLTNLWNLTDQPYKIINSYGEHTSRVTCLTISLNNIIASGSDDKTIKIWNVKSIMSMFTLNGHTGAIFCLTFLNNTTLISGSDDKSVKIWNTTNGVCMSNLREHTSWVRSLLILPNGLLASGTNDGYVKIWNISNSSCLHTFKPHTGSIPSMIQIRDSISLSVSNDSNFTLWDSINFTIIDSIFVNQSSFRPVAYSTNLDILVAGFGRSINFWFNFSKTYLPKSNIYLLALSDQLTSTNKLNGTYSTYKIFESIHSSVASTSPSQDKIFEQFLSKSTKTFISFDSTISSTFESISNINSVTPNENETESIGQLTSLEPNENKLFEPFPLQKSFSFDSIALNEDTKLINDLLSQTKYDINDCLSNCSNHGLCKLDQNSNKFDCKCNEYYFGSKCEIDLRPCSYSPCLNSIKCKNILKNGEIDFKCLCKDSFYGKRCENKVNLCQNETCSGNGLCKIINENQLNETIKCECFGFGMFEGIKCEIKTNKLKLIQISTGITAYLAIIVLIFLYLIAIVSDIIDKLLGLKPKIKIKDKFKQKKETKKKKNIFRKSFGSKPIKKKNNNNQN